MSELVLFPPAKIFANPYQHASQRRFSGPDFDEFVESIRASGVRQPPPARPHPKIAGAVQLQSGHRRFAAWKIVCPEQPFAVLVSPMSDLEMFEGCAEENFHRAELNDIERAEMVEAYKQLKPTATNADMARVFRLKDPASISNIRKLNQLPDGIKAHVAANALPQAVARQLVGILKVNPKAAQKIADEVAAAPPSEKTDTFTELANDLWQKMQDLRVVDWSADWLAGAPLSTDKDLGDGDHLLIACGECPFHIQTHRSSYCARQACFDEKFRLWAGQEAARVAGAKKFPLVQAGETVVAAVGDDYGSERVAQVLLHSNKETRALLRLAPLAQPGRSGYWQRQVFGSAAVTLVTTDKPAVDAYLKQLADKERSPSRSRAAEKEERAVEETPAQRAKRIAREEEEMNAKRAARSVMWKSYYDAKWLLESAARQIGSALAKTVSGAFVGFIEEEFCTNHTAGGAAGEIESRFEEEIKTASEEARGPLRLAHVALNVIAEDTYEQFYRIAENEHEFAFGQVRQRTLELCEKHGTTAGRNWHDTSFGVSLPTGWDIPPVHHTVFNCWYCGKFAGNMQEKLTKRDIEEEGWIDEGVEGVFCSQEHQAAYRAAHGARKPNNASAAKKKPTKGKK